MLIKYIKSVLWRVAKRLSYIEDARCLKVNCVMLGYVPEKPTATNQDMYHVRLILMRKKCQHTVGSVSICRPFDNLLITDRDYQSDSSLHGTSVSEATGSCILSKLLLTCNLNNIFLLVIQRLSRTFNAYVNTNMITYTEQSLSVQYATLSASQTSHISRNTRVH